MIIPSKNLGAWAADLFQKCSSSKVDRIERGTFFRNLYLTGDPNGDPQIYPEVFAFMDTLGSFLYSPVELRFLIDCYGASNPLERAKMRAATSEFHKQFRRSNTDTLIESAVLWGLVKGKTFIKNQWTTQGFKDILVQPEMMGVLEENLDSLDDQEAFCQTIYFPPEKLWRMLRTNPDRNEIMKKAQRYAMKGFGDQNPEQDNTLRQIVVGGLQPYQIAGQGNNNARGAVRWLEGPRPQFSADVAADLIALHEIWVWDDERADEPNGLDGEYTTLQFIGEDLIISGEFTHRNLFADQFDPANKEKKLKPTVYNPLSGHHPFNEICPNPLDGYFWGRSELCNVALLQKAINSRINGIGTMLRRQEDPPKFFSGIAGIKQSAYSMIKKAGGYFADSNPGAKVQDMYPQLPEGIWESLHEYQAMFDRMAGFTATMAGRGDKGVRSKEHSDALTRNASPRFKDRALLVERQIDAIGSKKLDMLKAHCADPITAWVSKNAAGIEGEVQSSDYQEDPPVPGQVGVDFTFYDLQDNCKVTVDSHSGSPAFSEEAKTLMFDLLKVGATDQEELLEHLNPSGKDRMIESLQIKRAAQAKWAEDHPEEAAEQSKKKKK
jgi:hypothetical protein